MSIEIGTSKAKLLVQSTTNLKNLRYKDQAPYGEPYIQKDIEKKSKELPDKWYKKYAQTGLTLVERRTDDVVRIAKFIGSPKGLLWESRQLGLQSMQNFFDQGRQHKFEKIHEEQKKTGKFVDALISGGKAILQGIGMTASTLTQVGLSGTGYHGHTFLTRAYLRKDGTVLGTILAGIGIGNGGDYLDGSSHAKGGSLIPVTADSLSNKRQLVLSGSTEARGTEGEDYIPANRDANPGIHFSVESQQEHNPQKSRGISAPGEIETDPKEPATYLDTDISVQKNWTYSNPDPSRVKANRSYNPDDVRSKSRYNQFDRNPQEVPGITAPGEETTYVDKSVSVQGTWLQAETGEPSKVKANLSGSVRESSKFNQSVPIPDQSAGVASSREEKGSTTEIHTTWFNPDEEGKNKTDGGKSVASFSRLQNLDQKSYYTAKENFSDFYVTVPKEQAVESSLGSEGKIDIKSKPYISNQHDIRPSWFHQGTTVGVPGRRLSFVHSEDLTYSEEVLNGNKQKLASAFRKGTVDTEMGNRLGPQGTGKTVNSKSIKGDTITTIIHKGTGQNYSTVQDKLTWSDSNAKALGLIPFTITKITPDKRVYLNFAANLNSYKDNYTGNWDSIQYVGRAENFYGYTGFTREISLDFTVVAMHRGDLETMYKALNELVGATAPSYAPEGLFMRGTLSSLTIGDLLKDKVGIIKSVGLTWKEDYTWSLKNLKEDGSKYTVPHALDVSISFTPIEDSNVREGYGAYFVFDGKPQSGGETGSVDPTVKDDKETEERTQFTPPAEPEASQPQVDNTYVADRAGDSLLSGNISGGGNQRNIAEADSVNEDSPTTRASLEALEEFRRNNPVPAE